VGVEKIIRPDAALNQKAINFGLSDSLPWTIHFTFTILIPWKQRL